jgi:hypothetical protein
MTSSASCKVRRASSVPDQKGQLDPSSCGSCMPEGTPKVAMLALEILESLAEAVPVVLVVPVAGAVEVDMVEMISAAEEHQRQCHKMQDRGRFLLLPVYLYWPEHIVSCLH